jgi:Ca-activated chloride channel family protein
MLRAFRPFVRTAACVALTAAFVGACSTSSSDRPHASSCPPAAQRLRVAVAPEIADVVTAAATDRGCTLAVVTGMQGDDVVVGLKQEPARQPELWIPDSSAWAAAGGLPAGAVRSAVSIARSPLVLAVPVEAARSFGWPARHLDVTGLLGSQRDATSSQQPRWVLADPASSPASAAAVLALRTATTSSGDRGMLMRVLRASSRVASADAQAARADGGSSAVATREQAVWAANASLTRRVAVYSSSQQLSLDYPALVLTANPVRRALADSLVESLRSAQSRALLQAHGFRDTADEPGSSLSLSRGVDPSAGRHADVVTAAEARDAAQVLSAVEKPSRLLVVIDVSGSMATPAGSKGTRLDVALAGAVNGLALYSDDTEVGLWEFATNLDQGSDHRELLPITTLGQGADGSSGRDKVLAAIQTVTVDRDGNTALYDTALAALRSLRHGWDPARQNTVVLLTDGRNDNPKGLTLPDVLHRLGAENDPRHPVALVGLAFGPGSDLPALRALAKATGGVAYRVDNPAQIRAVLSDAIARRPGTAVR